MTKLSVIKKQAWKAFSDYIRERDNWTCFTCGRTGRGSAMHAGHFLVKKFHGELLKFDPANVHAQCYICNRHADGQGAYYSLYLRQKNGQTFDLTLMSRIKESKAFKASPQWYKDIKLKYEAMLEAELAIKEFGGDTR
jgi:hypothetical protein